MFSGELHRINRLQLTSPAMPALFLEHGGHDLGYEFRKGHMVRQPVTDGILICLKECYGLHIRHGSYPSSIAFSLFLNFAVQFLQL